MSWKRKIFSDVDKWRPESNGETMSWVCLLGGLTPPQPGENCPCCRAHFLSTCCHRPDDKDGRSSCRRPETWGNQEARTDARAQGVAGGLGAPVLSTGDGTTETAQRSTRLFHVCFPPICDGAVRVDAYGLGNQWAQERRDRQPLAVVWEAAESPLSSLSGGPPLNRGQSSS